MNRQQEQALEQLADWIQESSYIVFFGGAGVSTESGVPDFRSVDGLYHQQYDYPPETILSHRFFRDKPEEFFLFYWKKMIPAGARPNDAHLALAKLEQLGKLKAVVTQNIDGLHQAAGSKEVLELHGSVHRNYCENCGRFYSLEELQRTDRAAGVPRCDCGGIIKPDVVLYEESLDSGCITKTIQHIRRADLLIVGGTSLTVYPAAGFLDYFTGEHLAVMNRDATSRDRAADLLIRTPIGESFHWVMNYLEAQK